VVKTCLLWPTADPLNPEDPRLELLERQKKQVLRSLRSHQDDREESAQARTTTPPYRLYVNAVDDIDQGCSPEHVRVEPERASTTRVVRSGS
jgi:hypothetical protein